MRKYSKLLLPALVVGGVLLAPAGVAEAKVKVDGDSTVYNSLSEAVQSVVSSNKNEATFTFTESEEDHSANVKIPSGSKYVINGKNLTFGGSLNINATEEEDVYLTINDLAMDGGSVAGMAIISQNQDTDPNNLYLAISGGSIKGYKKKGIYLTNAKELTIDGTKFNNNATTEQTPIQGDYAVDLNLIGVQGANITIKNAVFGGKSGGNSPIKVTQRGGIDDVMTDIPYYYDEAGKNRTDNPAATIEKLTISNCDFSAVTGNSKGDVIIGSSPNGDGSARTSAHDFNVEVIPNPETSTTLYVRGSKEEENNNTNVTREIKDKPLVQITDFSLTTTDGPTIDIKAGDKYTLNFSFEGLSEDYEILGSVPAVTFSSSDTNVATVNEKGVITAAKAGKATITASYESNGEKKTLQWNVTITETITEEPSKPVEGDPVETPTDEEPAETVENPQTFDGSMMFIIAGIMSALGLVSAGASLGKKSE